MFVTAPGELTVSCQMSPEPVQVARARERARQALPCWGLSEHAELAELIVSELVTNAIVHGNGPVEVRLSYAGVDLLAEVHDGGRGRPIRRSPSPDSEGGRGLEVIDGLIKAYGGARGFIDDIDRPGKTVYVAVCLAPDPEGTPRSFSLAPRMEGHAA
jgi:hypothetical protein